MIEGLYCGPQVAPGDLAAAWRLDSVAIALVAALLVAARGRPVALAGAGLLLLLYLSPLCALAASLFSARSVHHILLVAVAAPLLAPALRLPALAVGPAVALHTAAFWAWHLPAAYSFGVVGTLPYWTMQATFLGTALLAWRAVASAGPGTALLGLLALSVQMGLLGALLTFAGRPLYAEHLASAGAFGFTALDDQRLAGVLMWVPGALPYVAAGAALAWTSLRRAETAR